MAHATVTARARSNFAAQHLQAAEYFCMLVAKIEANADARRSAFAPPEYYHYWHASVVFAVLSMEANIYDVMMAPNRGEPSPLGNIALSTTNHRRPLVERYSLVHTHIVGRPLPLNHGIAQEASALVALRDEIVHYKTEWRDEAVVSSRLEKMLRSRITLNPFQCGDVFFPEQCVSANSSRWATTTARAFIVSFASDTGVRLNV